MVVALLAPEALLCAAIHQRIDAAYVAKETVQYLPHQQLIMPGTFTRGVNYILGRVNPGDVSTQRQAPSLCYQLI